MPSEPNSRQYQRRSTRVLLALLIEIHDSAEAFPAETIVVNLHGALISTSIPLNIGMTISVYVYLTDKRSMCKVVYIDPRRPLWNRIRQTAKHLRGVPLPPDNWEEAP